MKPNNVRGTLRQAKKGETVAFVCEYKDISALVKRVTTASHSLEMKISYVRLQTVEDNNVLGIVKITVLEEHVDRNKIKVFPKNLDSVLSSEELGKLVKKLSLWGLRHVDIALILSCTEYIVAQHINTRELRRLRSSIDSHD